MRKNTIKLFKQIKNNKYLIIFNFNENTYKIFVVGSKIKDLEFKKSNNA